MFLPLIVPLLFTFLSANEVTVIIQEVKQETVVEEFEQTCPISGFKIKGMIWTSCREDRTVVKGCISPSGQRIDFNMTYIDSRAEFKCTQKDNSVIFLPVSCVFKGRVHPVGSTFIEKDFFYKCTQRPDHSIAVEAIGCMDKRGDLVPLGSEFLQGNFIYACAEKDGKIVKTGIKCFVPSLNKTFALGESFKLDEYYYECQKRGARSIMIEAIGCASPTGELIIQGDQYVNGYAVMECQQDEEGLLTHKVVGCYAIDHRKNEPAHFAIGDRFYEEYSDKFGFVMMCAFENGKIRHKPVECIHIGAAAEYHLDINCAAIVGEKVFICRDFGGTQVMAQLLTKPKSIGLDVFLYQQKVDRCDTQMRVVEYE